MKTLSRITKALADEQRLKLLAALGPDEVCVCQLTELLKLAPSTVSKHLSILEQAGLIVGRKQGRWVHYRLAGRDAPNPIRETLNWFRRVSCTMSACAEIRKRLQAVMKMDPARLCRKQTGRA